MTQQQSVAAAERRRDVVKGTAWLFGALAVGFIDLRFLAVPALGIGGMVIAVVMGIIGIRLLSRGYRVSPYELLALASEREGGLLNAATIVKAYDCRPKDAERAMQEALRAGLFEDVTPPGGKAVVIRSLASDNLAETVEEGQEALDRAMLRLDAELAGNVDEFDAELEAARGKDEVERERRGDGSTEGHGER